MGSGSSEVPPSAIPGLAGYWDSYAREFARAREGIDVGALERLLEMVEGVRARGGQLFVLGNGGSAASAAHWACDFGKGATVPGLARFRVIAPTEQVAWHTALANDVAYADAMAEHLANWVRPGDLIVALSVSGNSENLVRAFDAGRRAGAVCVAIVGGAGGRLIEQADLVVVVPSRDYGVVEDLHMTINHVLTQHLRRTGLEAQAAAGRGGPPG